VAVLLCVFCSSVQAQSGTMGFANYKNRWIRVTSSPAAKASTSTLSWNGHAGPYAAPQSGDVPAIPAAGYYRLRRSAIGHPISGAAFFGPDYYIGERIQPPEDALSPLTGSPKIEPPTSAFYVGIARNVYAGDAGPVTISWRKTDGTTHTIQYVISNQPVEEPKRIYHTEGATDKGGLVDLTPAPTLVIHYNTQIRSNSDLWVDGQKRLHAANRSGLVAAHWNLGGTFDGIIVIDVRNYVPDAITSNHNVAGDVLEPDDTPAGMIATPTISRGDEEPRPYVFQYDTDKDPSIREQVVPVRPTSANNQIYLYWKKTGNYGEIWPYELHAYQTRWDPAVTDWQRIYYTADGTLGPTVNCAGVDFLRLYYNDRVTSTVTVYINTNPRAIYATGGLAETGKILLRMDTSTATGPSVFEFVEVFDYIPDYVTPLNVGDQLLPTRVVADPLQPDTYVRNTWNGNPTDPSNYVYQHNVIGPYKGAAFAVRPTTLETQIELFFKRMGQMGLKWPYEMHRYTATWPAGAQLYVRGTNAAVPGPRVPIPKNLNATLMPYQEFVPQTGSPSQVQHAELNGSQFYSDLVGKTVGDYYAVLQYQTGPTNSPGSEWVGFQVVKCVQNTDTRHFNRLLHAWEIGTEITSATYHRGPAPGFIYHLLGVDNEDKYDPRIYNEGGLGYATGQIFPVFPGQMEVWWYNLTTHGSTSGSTYTIQWPSRVMRYDCTWPASPEEMTIESQAGSGQIPFAHRNPEIYYENDPTRIGYNPNCEHAALFPYGSGIAAFALRCDLNAESTDKPVPYVLVKYQDSTDRDLWRFRVFHVSAGNVIRLNARAGSVVPKPYPLAALQPDCGETTPGLHNGNYGVSGPYWQDRNLTFWARAAADDGGTSEIVMRYWYPVQPGFVFPNPVDRAKYPVGSRTPWLNKLQVPYDTPADVVYTVSWPPLIPSLKTGETLVVPKFGLPAIMGQMSVERIYESLNHNTTGSIPGQRNIMLIDPLRERSVSLNSLPTGADSIETENRAGKLYFSGLPPQLRTRVSYDPINKKLALVGEFYDMLGEDILLINVLTIRDRAFLDALSANQAFRDAVNALYELTSGPIILTGADSNSVGKAVVGVSALNPNASPTTSAYVTLVMQNHPSCGALPVSLEVIRVEDSLYRGEIKVIEPDCCFDEKLTLRHSGDFAGKADQYIFKWEYHPDMDGLPPATGSPLWRSYPAEPVDGVGALDVTIRGPGLFTLSDNWFRVQYRLRTDPDTSPSYSRLTNPQLAPGWIKRVIGQINPFTQRASGGGIQGAEQRFSQFQTRTVNTVVSMIEQAGKRWVGNVPMNCGPGLDALGLIEIYDTVLGRGKQLSIDAGYSYPPANNALLLAAGRIADLYMLVGNEAYADAADPTIAFGTEDGIYGTEASSIHCFMNQTASLLEEELALLRGRDNSLAPGVQVDPLYNRLMWNFTRDINGGEVAYALNYNIQDALGNADGTINELDAMRLYPQGHGDAWGHYLTAIKRYYALLKHPNFDWVPRAEAVLVGGQPVTVDYLDERKFAKAAAAKAQTGAEIVNLTYRQAYVEDPAGQWQGYKDGNSDRGWGLSEWASRAGQGAYFDWLVANAILPSSDTLHTGIQKIDRTTVAELREIASAFGDVKQQMINADIGLNPLGLAKNVVPFDIDPAKVLMEGSSQTHFEQIYDRAIMALNNAVTVFDHATNCTQLLRRQSDKQTEFQNKVTDQESDFKSRLIEVFGYPYAGDIGAGKTYPQGYDGPDLYHYDYANVSELLGRDREPTQMFTMQLADFGEGNVDDTGNVTSTTKEISFHISMTGFGLCPPEGEDWGQRRAPGEIQRIRAQLIQLYGQFQKTRIDYANVLRDIQVRSDRIDERIKLKTDKISVRTKTRNEVASFAAIKIAAHEVELCVKRAADSGVQVMQSVNEAVPKSFIAGLAAGGDVTAPIRGVTQTVAVAGATALNITGDIAEMVQASMDLAKEAVQSKQEIDLLELDENKEIHQMLVDLTVKLSDEQSKRLELFMLIEQMSQMAGEYAAALAKGLRILDGRTRFRIQTASQVQSYRYKDMAFRIFRNDALQKYRAQFDMAARYVYLAAKAYDYETNLLDQDRRAGEFFMTNIIRARAIGSVIDSVPRTGSGLGDPGLADILARMKLNWDLALKGQLGFNNPQTETNRFSLRMELFRSVTTDTWRTVLRQYRVDDILTIPEFKRYCRVFQPHETTEPGIVIPVSTTVNFGFNFFGEKLAAGDSAYDSTNFATKVRSVGVWFTGYDALTSYGLSNTPRVYLIPVGYDIMRSPTGETGEIRLWKILDQKMPIPFPVGPSDLASPSWIPMVDTLSEEYAAIRKFSSFRAYHDSGEFSLSETITDSRLIGRSVWNTRWLLIIPAGTLHSNRQMGLDTFINGVTDIKMFFSTYAYSGN
jgi:hypothetical protein